MNDAREITARFDSVCPETGRPIRKGDRCVYFARQRKVYHVDSKAAAQYRELAFAKSWGMPDANW